LFTFAGFVNFSNSSNYLAKKNKNNPPERHFEFLRVLHYQLNLGVDGGRYRKPGSPTLGNILIFKGITNL
jgi:hypothetical protein